MEARREGGTAGKGEMEWGSKDGGFRRALVFCLGWYGLYRLHHKAAGGAGEIDVCVLSRFIWNTVAIILLLLVV